MTNVLHALSLGFSEAILPGLCIVATKSDFWKISLSSILEATNEFGVVTLADCEEGGVVVVDFLDNLRGGLPDFFSFFLVGFGLSTEFA